VKAWVLSAAVASVGLWPAPARAGEVVRTFRDLQGRVLIGETVTATDKAGQKTKGKLLALNDTTLTLQTEQGDVALQGAELTKVQARRSGPLWNGALIGFAVPTVTIGLFAAEYGCSGDCAALIAFYGAIGAGVGVGIDALVKGNITVLDTQGKGRVALAPILGKSRKGVLCSVRF
jgi:hypothetical protein